jgi:fermentation-respiration switch protein FrsA (DUF1100 family)
MDVASVRSFVFSSAILATKVVGTLALGVVGLLYVFQDKLLYMPNPPGFPKNNDENPPGAQLPSEWSVQGDLIRRPGSLPPIPFEEAFVTTADGEKIHTWLMYQQETSAEVPTLLYFHGNAGNMGFRLQNAAAMYCRAGINVLMMDYRGYGKSTGTPTEWGLNLDAEAVLLHAVKHPRLTRSPMVVFGRSLGGGVCFSLAAKHPNLVKAIVVENTFLSIGAMVDCLMPYIARLKPLVLRIKWDNDVKVKSAKQPILFISGDSDELVPPFHMKKLFDTAHVSAHKEFFSVSGGTHNDTWLKAGSKWYSKLKEFLDNGLKGDTKGGSAASSVCDSDGGSDAQQSSLPTMNKNFRVK